MLQNIPGDLINWWHWLLSQLGWNGSLNWVQIVVLVLAVLGACAILRRLFGGGGSSSSSTVIYPAERRGFTTRAYTANSKLSDFSVPMEVYNFRMPSPRIKTSGLTRQINVDMDKGKKLFVPPNPTSSQAKSNKEPDWTKARKLFVPPTPTAGQSRSPSKGPDWNLAQKLCVPKVGETKGSKQLGKTEKTVQSFHTNPSPDWNRARELFVSSIGEPKETKQSDDTGETSQLGQATPGPDWNLARKLFVPNFGTKRK